MSNEDRINTVLNLAPDDNLPFPLVRKKGLRLYADQLEAEVRRLLEENVLLRKRIGS